MADFVIWSRVVLTGPTEFTATVSAIPLRSADLRPELDVLTHKCASRHEAMHANEVLIQSLREALIERGDAVLGVEIEYSPRCPDSPPATS